MLTIDHYVLRLYVKILLVSFFSLTGLYVVIDAFSNLEELLRIAENEHGLGNLIVQYYGARVLTFFDRTSPLLALVAATFVATQLQRSNEMAALMAAGIPKIRIVMPLILGTVGLSLLAAVNREVGIPPCRDNLIRNAQDWDGTVERKLHPRYDNRTGILLDGATAVAAERRIGNPAFRRRAELGQFGTQLIAANAFYHPPQDDRPGGYLLDDVELPEQVHTLEAFQIDGRKIVFSAPDAPWLEPDQCFVVSDVSFEQLAAGNAWRQYSSTRELVQGLHNPSLDFAADVRVTVHARLIQPLLDVTLLLLGLPVILSRETRNIFVSAGICLLIVAGFVIVVLACHQAGGSTLITPALAAWLPLMLFVPLSRNTVRALWQ